MRNALLIVGAAATLAACSSGGDGRDTRVVQLPSNLPVAETVNGTAVPQPLLEAVARARNLDLAKPEQREQALKLVTDYVLLAQAAQQSDFYAKGDFSADVEAARLQGVANATMQELQRQTPVTDELVRGEYDAQVAKAGKNDYDFTQLLFADEADALKAQGEILAGKPFAEVYDEWRAKAKQAKAFTRVHADQLPESLATVMAGLKNGETTKTPVKTQFGWHVLRLDITNPFTPPAFDQVKEGIRRNLSLKVAQERLQKLKEQAKIEYPTGAQPPKAEAAKTPAAAPAKKD
ncbi:MAG TPA: peptidyl-prolyl cis-trans isomerase [Rudaea sp.]